MFLNKIISFFSAKREKISSENNATSEFVTAIDFETANSARSSVCAIGIAVVDIRAGKVVDSYYSLIKPTPFRVDSINYSIHKISESELRNAPDFSDVWEKASKLIKGTLVAHNLSFDYSCLRSATAIHGIALPDFKTDCTLLRSKELLCLSAYKLSDVASYLKIPLKHHNALSDAIACGLIYSKLKMNYGFVSNIQNLKSNKSKIDIDKKVYNSMDIDFDVRECVDLKFKTICLLGEFERYYTKDIENFIISQRGEITKSIRNNEKMIVVVGDRIDQSIQSKKIKTAFEKIKLKREDILLLSENNFASLFEIESRKKEDEALKNKEKLLHKQKLEMSRLKWQYAPNSLHYILTIDETKSAYPENKLNTFEWVKFLIDFPEMEFELDKESIWELFNSRNWADILLSLPHLEYKCTKFNGWEIMSEFDPFYDRRHVQNPWVDLLLNNKDAFIAKCIEFSGWKTLSDYDWEILLEQDVSLKEYKVEKQIPIEVIEEPLIGNSKDIYKDTSPDEYVAMLIEDSSQEENIHPKKWKKFTAKHWLDLIINNDTFLNKFEEYNGVDKFKTKQWIELLQQKPELSEKYDVHIVNIFKDQKVDTIIKLLQCSPLLRNCFENLNIYENLEGKNWGALLRAHPEYSDICHKYNGWGKIKDNYNWSNIIISNPEFEIECTEFGGWKIIGEKAYPSILTKAPVLFEKIKELTNDFEKWGVKEWDSIKTEDEELLIIKNAYLNNLSK